MGRHHPLAGKALSLDDYLAWPHLQVSGGGDKDSPVEQVLAPQGLSRRWFARVPFFQAAVEVLLRTDCLMTTRLISPGSSPAAMSSPLSICRLLPATSSIICCGISATIRIRPTAGFASWPTPSCGITCNAQSARVASCSNSVISPSQLCGAIAISYGFYS